MKHFPSAQAFAAARSAVLAATFVLTGLVSLDGDRALAQTTVPAPDVKTPEISGQPIQVSGDASVIVDVAGNADRCAAAMRAARSMKSGGRLWCIAAINDTDDEASLARLGNLLERFADHAIVTAVPEKKKSFLAASHAVLDGVEECAAMRLVANQTRAISWAMSEAKPTDTILVMTNESSATANQERSKIETIEKLVEKIRDQQEIARPKPTLKVFG